MINSYSLFDFFPMILYFFLTSVKHWESDTVALVHCIETSNAYDINGVFSSNLLASTT